MPTTYRDPKELLEAVSSLKVGDAVYELIPAGGEHAARLERLGLSAVFGCIDLVSSPEMTVPSVTLWSTLFSSVYRELSHFDARTFAAPDIASITTEIAEIYIPEMSHGRFTYGQPVNMIYNEGTVHVTIDSYFDGIVSGLTEDGQRASGGASYFYPE